MLDVLELVWYTNRDREAVSFHEKYSVCDCSSGENRCVDAG